MTALALIALLIFPAQERGPAERQMLVDLAGVLGEAHAIRQICYGPEDQFWRSRMLTLLETEDADYAFSERLRATFNQGFLYRQNRHPACTPETREAEATVQAHGQALAERLARRPAGPPADDENR